MSQNAYDSSIDIVQRLVDDDSVFFIGESPTRALPLAVAAMRGSIDGVWAAGYESRFKYNNLDDLFRDFDNRVSRNAEQGHWEGAISRVQEQIWRLRDSIPFIHSLSWRFSSCVDATRLTWTVGSSRWTRPIPSRNIFWMCPWCRYADTELGDLLCSFIQAAAAIQGEGDMLLLGLAVESYWGPCYHLEDVEAAAREHGYLVLPRDRRFVEEALRYGYVHHTLSPRGAEDKLHGPLFWQLKVHPFLKRSAYAVSLGAELPFATMDSESWEELVQVAEGRRRVAAGREDTSEDTACVFDDEGWFKFSKA